MMGPWLARVLRDGPEDGCACVLELDGEEGESSLP